MLVVPADQHHAGVAADHAGGQLGLVALLERGADLRPGGGRDPGSSGRSGASRLDRIAVRRRQEGRGRAQSCPERPENGVEQGRERARTLPAAR